MKRLVVLTVVLASAILISFKAFDSKTIPVTTSSPKALSLYNEAKKYFDDVKLDKALATFGKALDADPDFFMANYQLAFYYLMNKSYNDFVKYSNAAVNCKAKLSDGEEMMREALSRIKQGKTDITDIGKRLVEMYPGDPNSYDNMVYFQSLVNDSTGVVETLKKAITVVPDHGPFYNQLGYAYITMKQNDKAEAAFDKYIELEPKNPNVYDSKGDYYMYIKKYDKAYESYIQANSMDPSFSKDKAELAKQLYEKTEGKKIDIISM